MLIVLVKITWHYNHKIFNRIFYIEVFYPGSNRYKINETLREQWRAKAIKNLNFHTPNFIPEEKNMKWTCKRHTYELAGRQMHSFRTQFLVLMSAGILAKLHLSSEVVFRCGCFFISSSNISKTSFLEHLCTMTSISWFEKDSVATIRDSFKKCILACKISNQMHTNFEKRKVPQTKFHLKNLLIGYFYDSSFTSNVLDRYF